MNTRKSLRSIIVATVATFCLGAHQVFGSVSATVQPPSPISFVGSNLTFTAQVTTNGGEIVTGFTWKYASNGVGPFIVIAGATNATLPLTSLQTNDAGVYFVTVLYSSGTNTGLSVPSAVASLTVRDQARLATQPQALILPSGTNATFTVTALGQLPLAYQWRVNGGNLTDGARVTGSVSNTLNITGLTTNDTGDYDIVVTNVYAAITSQVARLAVYDPPVATTPLSNVTVVVGSSAIFNFTPGGSAPLTFAWQRGNTLLTNGGRISGATTSSLKITSTTTNDNGNYSVTFTNPVGAATTGPVTLTVLLPPVITSSTNVSGKQGSNFTYQTTVTGSPTITFGANGLPTGLGIDPVSGLLSGIPLVFGNFSVTLYATNAATVSSTNVTIKIASDVPGITSALTKAGKQGTVLNYNITGSNQPVFFSAVGLPPGINLVPGTNLITGPPISSGTFLVTIGASNQFGGDTKVLTLNIASDVPVITSALTATGTESAPGFTYTITATNNPTSFGAIGLPSGLILNTNTGVISGTPVYGGTNDVVISAANAYGTATATLEIDVAFATLPALAIINVTNNYSSPYLLDFMFSLRDDPAAETDPSKGNAVARPPEQIVVTCIEGDTNTLVQTQIGNETAFIVNRAIDTKQLKTFVVMDYTYSMFIDPGAITNMQASVEGLIDQEPPSAQFGIYEFNADDVAPQLVSSFTADKNLLKQDIEGIQSTYVQGDYAGSRFYDALSAALTNFSGTNVNEQRYLIALSDGNDDSSILATTAKAKTLPDVIIAQAKSNNVAIYCVGFGPNPDTTDLQKITSGTQGRYYTAAAPQDVATQFALLLKDLNSQYLLRWATLQRNPTTAFQPMFQVSIDGVQSDIYNDFNTVTNPGTINTNMTPPVTNPPTTMLVTLAPFYTNSAYAGNIKQGSLTLFADAQSNASSVTLNAFYVPRFVRQVKVNYRANYPCTASLLNNAPGQVLAGWTLAQTNDGGGGQILTLTSPNTNDVTTSLPYGIRADLVNFQFAYQALPTGQQAFSYFNVDNTIYSNMPPTGQSFVLTNTNSFIANFTVTPAHGTPVPWLASYGYTNNPATDELLIGANGYPLWQDYIAGLNPTNATSTFAILPGSTIKPGVQPVITFATVLGRVYRVDTATAFGAWSTLSDNIAGTGGVVSITDNRNLSGLNSIYYRVAVSYP